MKIAISCVKCKGRLWCGKEYCPILYSFKIKTKIFNEGKKHFEGYSLPELLVGWRDYPGVKVFTLAAEEKNLKSEEEMYGLKAEEIIRQRAAMFSGGKRWNVKKRLEEKMQELALSKKITAVDMEFEKILKPRMVFDSYAVPMPLNAKLKNLELAEEPKIPKIVEKLSIEPIKANEGLEMLYERNFEISYISRIFSSGILGIEKRLVPTRWSITAVDDIIGKNLIEKIKEFKIIENFWIFENSYLGNKFLVLLLPKEWSFELLECWYKGSLWQNAEDEVNQDHEFFSGRKSYAQNTSGAYYASRLAVVEYLCRIKKQAAAIIFREISNEYNIPLGVWVIRESVRDALGKGVKEKFDNLKEALEFIGRKLDTNIKNWTAKSKLLDRFKNQRRILEFIT